MRIVFFGTPGFAVQALDKILESNFEVLAVVTAPDKPAGRGRKLQASEVKLFAEEKNLTVLQPEKLKNEAFLSTLKSLNADIFVIVAYRMLPEIVWNMPPKGTLNLHASYLPNYRGAAPINWAIINGEKQTGITTFLLKHQIDTGDVLMRKKIDVFDNETAGSLHDKLAYEGSKLLVETLKKINTNSVEPISQEKLDDYKGNLKHAPKIFKKDCQIDWSLDGNQIKNLVRGLSPYPAAFSFLLTDSSDIQIKIFEVNFEPVNTNVSLPFNGNFDSDGKNYLRVVCKNGWISLIDVQMQGKKRMKIEELLRGYQIPKNALFISKTIE